MKALTITAAAAIAASLAGCSSLSGYDANTQFACKAPPGVLCESMSGIYANAEQKNLPGQRVNMAKAEQAAEVSRAKDASTESVLSKPIYSGTPIRSAPRVLRVWFAPWEDSDGDLHDQDYVYMQVDTGRWLIEHNRRRVMDAYRPVRAPSVKTTAPNAQVQGTSNVQTGAAQGQEAIGVVQGRPGEQDAAGLLGGIQMPGQLGQPGGQPPSDLPPQ